MSGHYNKWLVMAESKSKGEVAPQTVTHVPLTGLCIGAWLIPGLGHFLLKRPRRALTFLILITFLFFWGLSLGAKIYTRDPQQPLSMFAMFAQAGMGLPYIFARFMAHYAENHSDSFFYTFGARFLFGRGNIEWVTFEYGNTFAIVAGLLNFLVILDAYDIATGRKKA